MPALPRLLAVLAFMAAWLVLSPAHAGDGERVRVVYWEKWTGFEKDAMRAVVDDFNHAQDRVFVEYVSVSDIRTVDRSWTGGG